MAATGTPVPVPIPTQGERRDLDPLLVPPEALVSSENMLFRTGTFRSRPGLTKSTGNTTGTRIMGLNVRDIGSGVLVAGTTTGWWRRDESTQNWVDITGTPLTGATVHQVDFRLFKTGTINSTIGVNGKDTPKIWDGAAANYSDLGGSPPIARTLAIANNHLLLGNLSTGGTISDLAVDVSAALNPEAGWGGATLTALLADTPGPIVSMREYSANRAVIYKSDAIYEAEATGGLVPFNFPMREAGISGPVSTLAVLEVDSGLHAYLAIDGSVMLWNGSSLTPFENNSAVQRLYVQTARQELGELAFGYFNRREREAWWHYVENGQADINLALCVSFQTGAVHLHRYPSQTLTAGVYYGDLDDITLGELNQPLGEISITLGQMAQRTQRVFLGDITGQGYHARGNDDDGQNIYHMWETGIIALGDQTRSKTVQEIEHLFLRRGQPTSIAVDIGLSDDGQQQTYSALLPFDISQPGPYQTGTNTQAKLVSLRYQHTGNVRLTYRGATIKVRTRGQR